MMINSTDSKISVFSRIKQEIRQRKLKAQPYVVGITGIDLSGKTEFAKSLSGYLVSEKLKTVIIHLDDFHNPRAYRNSGPDPVENYLHRNFSIEKLIRELLLPLREKRVFSVSLTLLDLFTDKYEVQRNYIFDEETVVLLEGIFLFRKELLSYLDYKIFIEITFEEARRRAVLRDVPLYGESFLKRYDEKYWPAQRRHLAEYPPLHFADMIVDNTDWEHPKVTQIR